ncbi:LOW QUALITY PROTEIN: fatty acid synthase-like [Harpegnathos saltator]|uniref:LOW QUALITY PROTEIN: fatty acid synthase-like n=1 Tax=Harpegnathos saltator TaxID=610380 RepID=UPI000DBEE7EF|nr:LOW QUALITY PROTEIN: fatty acid synthase-like [Harpegnathos saltator]
MEDSKSYNPYEKMPPGEEIVISGMAGRFPDTDNIKELQENLLNMMDLGSDDNRRWKNANYDMPDRSGKVNNINKFDAEYFGISSVEAHITDPMCRMLLEHTYEALIDAGVNPKELRGTKTGVFIGSCYSEAANITFLTKPQSPGYSVIGFGKYWLANSISNWLGLTGPSYVMDTACSSTHYAIAEAFRMIRGGECDAAIVGGANLCLHPNITLQFFHLGVLSADGYCKPFDVSSTGYMRSETIAVIYLQKVKNAKRIYATLVYSKTNCDGWKPEGITYPSFSMQKKLLEDFYNDCGITPEELSYMEAHATGTLAGDPPEVDAIDQALCSKRTTPLLVGSIKSNLGHSESASGLCQVVKVLIAMETGIIPPTIHYKTPRKELTPIIEGRMNVVTEPTSWNGGYIGINNFGFGGGNCHILLKSNPKNKINVGIPDGLPRLVAVSGRTEEAVQTLLDDVNSRQIDVEYMALLHSIHAENIEGHPYRGYTIAGPEVPVNKIRKVENCANSRRPICFVFPGTEVEWRNIELMKLPVFAKAIKKCNETLKQRDICVTDIIKNKNKTTSNSIVESFVGIIAIQIGIVDILTHIGILSDYTIGQSIGQLISEYVDGRFTIETTILTAYFIGTAFEQAMSQVDDITKNQGNYLDVVRSKLLEHLYRILPANFLNSRGVTQLGRSRSERDKFETAAEYYVDIILNPVPLQKITALLPKDTILVDIVPHNTFQPLIPNLQSVITLISLYKRGQKHTMQNFLEGIGDLYNVGLQPQIASLYPPVQFPVSRGTPMISPLIRWNHSEDYYFYHHIGESKIFSRERIVTITPADADFEYMSDHIIDGRNLLPATGYLYEIWHTIGLLSGIDHRNIPIVFENVKFIRAIHLSRRDKLDLTIMIQEGGNNFEIIEGENVIVSGVVRVPDDIVKEKISVQFLPKNEDDEECMNAADIYKELRLRGYQYKDPGDMSTIRWVEGRTSPKLNRENVIHKIYAALNFKDILIATGKLALESFQMIERDIDSFLGFEFVGYDGFGQRIMAMCSGRGISNVAIQDHVTSWVIPDEWTFEDAATVPCVYATSCYALYEKGKMKRGDKVLIHSGTGGVGQAAIHLALYEKCEVFTTVGTLEKRQFIRETFPSILDDHIGNSRDTSFEQMILEQTRGRGVDIVLNSLAEEKLQASIRCLAKGGRFLEIGKYDVIADNTLDRMIFAKGISFHAIMLDNIISSVSKNYGIVCNYMLQCLKNGSIKPLPRKVFEKTEVEDAFRYMATGKHIGKILIKIRDENEPLSLPILAYPRFFCKSHMSYIILGGLGGFGLELADWLILRGAKNLLLTSRTGLRNGYQRSRVELWKSYGVNVQIIASAEASDHKDGASILNTAIEMGPVDAIFNLAVVLKDSLYKNQTTESFEESFKPKAMATKTMDELSRKMCPDLRYFVVFSSVSCGRGNSGQTNYGMANSIMERICERRVQDGLPGMAIQWGAVGDVGLVADMQKDNKELIIGGTLQQKIQSCLQSLDTFMVLNKPIVGSMVVPEKRATFGGVMDIVETVASIMGIKDVKAVRLRTPLSEMGMDSMTAVEIKQTLEKEFDVYLTAQDIRTLTFEKLHNMADKNKRFEQIETLDSGGIKFVIRLINNLDMVPDVCLEITTRSKMGTKRIFLLPGIEGCGSVFNSLASKIEGPVTCLQHGSNNIPTSESVLQSAASLLPHIISKMEGSAEFIIVGYSYGSLIAIELTRLLEARNFTGRLILIDGTPDYMKTLKDQYFPFTNLQEFQNNVLLGLIDLFYSVDNTSVLLELSKHDTWEKKWDAVVKCLSDDIVQVTSLENYKIYCTTVYKHLIAIHEYDASSSPPLKSPVLLLKPTTSNLPFADENSDLKKVTEGNVQVRHVEGNHFTMLENDELADIINEILS